MYGLVATSGRDAGMPIQKPWQIACSPNSSLPSLLNKCCDRSHDHTPCAGRNTLLTQAYTPEIAKIVHTSIRRDIACANAASKKDLSDGTFDHASAGQYKGRAIVSVEINEMDEAVALAALA